MNRRLKKLVDALVNCQNFDEYTAAFSEHSIRYHDIKNYVLFSNTRYTRNRICYQKNRFELNVNCWSKGQLSPIHDHGNSNCLFMCVDGLLQEERYTYKDQKIQSTRISVMQKNKVMHINNKIGLHQMRSPKRNSVSLHLYLKPLLSFEYYNHKTRSLLRTNISQNN